MIFVGFAIMLVGYFLITAIENLTDAVRQSSHDRENMNVVIKKVTVAKGAPDA